MPPALKPITSFLILLSHNFLNSLALVIFLVILVGIGFINLFFKKALTNFFDKVSSSILLWFKNKIIIQI